MYSNSTFTKEKLQRWQMHNLVVTNIVGIEIFIEKNMFCLNLCVWFIILVVTDI